MESDKKVLDCPECGRKPEWLTQKEDKSFVADPEGVFFGCATCHVAAGSVAYLHKGKHILPPDTASVTSRVHAALDLLPDEFVSGMPFGIVCWNMWVHELMVKVELLMCPHCGREPKMYDSAPEDSMIANVPGPFFGCCECVESAKERCLLLPVSHFVNVRHSWNVWVLRTQADLTDEKAILDASADLAEYHMLPRVTPDKIKEIKESKGLVLDAAGLLAYLRERASQLKDAEGESV